MAGVPGVMLRVRIGTVSSKEQGEEEEEDVHSFYIKKQGTLIHVVQAVVLSMYMTISPLFQNMNSIIFYYFISIFTIKEQSELH